MSETGRLTRAVPPPQLGALLRLAWQRHQVGLRQAFAEAGFGDVRASYIRAMGYPPSDGLRPTELALRLGLSKQATNDLLRDLERLGYVSLVPDPDDGRARLIRYTDKGWRYFDLGWQTSREIARSWAEMLGQERIAQLEETLREILALDSLTSAIETTDNVFPDGLNRGRAGSGSSPAEGTEDRP